MSPRLLVRRSSVIARTLITCTILTTFAVRPSTAHADVVDDWNVIALAQINAGHPGPANVIDLAAIQAAVHDAVQAYERQYQPYALSLQGVGSQVAAVATAARDVLVARLPAAQGAATEAVYQQYLLDHGLTASDPGVGVGQQAAAGVLALRLNDGSFPNPPPPDFTGNSGIPGMWRPTPPGFAPMAAPWAAAVRPYTLESTAGFQPEPPPALTSGEYAEAYNEVKKHGSATSARTPEQNHLVRFWADNFLVQWNRALRDVSAMYTLSTGQKARLLALANMATADAFICAWEAKRFYAFWRPISAIREGHLDGNDATAGDPNWVPAITTPPYPDYTSGANNVTSAMTRILALVFDSDHVSFTVTSLSPLLQPGDATSITYYKFSDAMKDVIDVRILQGIHFRFADTEARAQGRRVANHAFKNYLQPLDGNGKGRR